MSFLLGGKAPKQQTQTVTQQTQMSPEQQSLLGSALPIIKNRLTSGIQTPKQAGMQTLAPLSSAQLQGNQLLQDTAQGQVGTTESLGRALNFGLDPNAVFQQNPALRGAIDAAQRPVIENFTSAVLPNIRSGASNAGQYGSSRQGIAEGIASRGLQHELGDISSTITNNAFDTSMDTFGRTLAAAPRALSAQTLPAQFLSQAGAEQQQQEQIGLDQNAQDFWTQQLLPFQLAQSVAGTAFGLPGTNVATTQGPGQVRQPGLGGKLLSGASTGAGIGAALPAIGGPWGAGIGALLSIL